MFETRLSIFKTCMRKVTSLSKPLYFFRKKKVFYFKILAPGTIKVNTRDCYFLKDVRAGKKVKLCKNDDGHWIQHCFFYFNPAGMPGRIMTFFLFGRRDPKGVIDKDWHLNYIGRYRPGSQVSLMKAAKLPILWSEKLA